MSNAKVISIIDHAVAQARREAADALAHTVADLVNVTSAIAHEVMEVRHDVSRLREDVDKLKQGGGSPKLSAEKTTTNR